MRRLANVCYAVADLTRAIADRLDLIGSSLTFRWVLKKSARPGKKQ